MGAHTARRTILTCLRCLTGDVSYQRDKLTRNYDFLGLRSDAPPSGVSVAELRARYDENIAYADQVVGDFLEWLDQTGRLIVLSSSSQPITANPSSTIGLRMVARISTTV